MSNIQRVTAAKMKSISALERKLKDFETTHSILQTKYETLRAAHATLGQSNTALVANIANAKLDFSRAWEKLGLSLPSVLHPQLILTPPLYRRAGKEREGKNQGESGQHQRGAGSKSGRSLEHTQPAGCVHSVFDLLSSHLISPCANALAELKQRHVEELEAKHNAAVTAKDEEIAVITLSRNTTYSKLSERDAQIVTQAKDIEGLSARLEQAARGVDTRHAARSELGMIYDIFFRISHLHIPPCPLSLFPLSCMMLIDSLGVSFICSRKSATSAPIARPFQRHADRTLRWAYST